jgi:hypothetical protein
MSLTSDSAGGGARRELYLPLTLAQANDHDGNFWLSVNKNSLLMISIDYSIIPSHSALNREQLLLIRLQPQRVSFDSEVAAVFA